MTTPAATEAVARSESRREALLALSNGLKLGGSLAFTWSIALGIRVVVPRHLGPGNFGALNFADAFSATFALALSLGVDTYIRKEVSVRTEHASDFFGGITLLRMLLSLVVFGGMAAFLHFTNRSPEVIHAAYVFAASRFFESVNVSLGALLHSRGEVSEQSVWSIATKVLWAAGILIAVKTGAGLWAYAAALLLSELAKTAVLFRLARKYLGLLLHIDVAQTRATVIGSLPFFLTVIAQGAYSRLDVSMLAMYASDQEIGYYSSAVTMGWLAMLLAPLFSWVVMPMLARAAVRSEEELAAVLQQLVRFVLAVSVPISLAFALGSDVWLRLLFGDAFVPGAAAMRVLAPMYVATYVAMVASQALVATGRGWTSAGVMIMGMLVNAALNLVAIPGALKLYGGMPGAAGLGSALSLLLSEILVCFFLLRPLGKRFFNAQTARTLLRTAAVVIAVATLDHLLRFVGPWRLAVDGVAYVALALAAGLVSPNEVVEMVRGLLREKKAAG